ncbi:MAG: gamma-glutamyltransferase [Hyphomicrobiales bacterium]|nr:gamma-glutamyltransferase [Hyphomicrobiales bacterium]
MSSTLRFTLAAVTAPDARAATVGRDILSVGGSALEAALAMAAALAVVLPHRAGLGSDAQWLIREPGGRTHVIDAGGLTGVKADAASYRKAGHHEMPRRGALAAATVPGAVAGWERALEATRAFGGRLPLPDLIAPAIKLARDGFPQNPSSARAPDDLATLAEAPGFAAVFLDDGKLTAAGATRVETKIGDLLEQISHAGLRDFYRGDAGRELAADMARLDIALTRADLEGCEAKVRKPLSLRLGARTYFVAPAPSQGFALLHALALHARLRAPTRDDFASLHAYAETLKRTLRIAAPFALDPSLVDGDPLRWLAPDALEREAQAISRDRADAAPYPAPRVAGAFFGAVDPTGLTVGCLATLGDAFGSGCVLGRTGVLLGNRAAAFSLDPRAPNVLAPKLRAPNAPAPTLCVQDEGRVMAFGGGAPQIDLQLATRIADGMDLQDAIDAPRLLGRDRNLLQMEDRFDPSVLRALDKAGHEIALGGAPDDYAPAGVVLRRRDGSVEGAHDARTDGAADGL